MAAKVADRGVPGHRRPADRRAGDDRPGPARLPSLAWPTRPSARSANACARQSRPSGWHFRPNASPSTSPGRRAKEGSHYDLPIALALLEVMEAWSADELGRSDRRADVGWLGDSVPGFCRGHVRRGRESAAHLSGIVRRRSAGPPR